MQRYVLLLFMSLSVSACITAGPDYSPQHVAASESFLEADTVLFNQGSPDAQFWRAFDDATLTGLIERGLKTNTDIMASLARLEQSRALSGLSVYSLFPTVTSSASSERNRQSSEDPFAFEGLGVSEVYRLEFDSLWEIDLFGSLKRQNQEIVRRVQADEALLHDVQRTVTGEIAHSYFALRGAETQLKVLQQGVNAQAQTADILQKSLDAGRGTAFDVARARALLHALEAGLPDIEAQVAASRQRLAVLTADSAANIDVLLKSTPSDSPALAFPDSIKLGTPEEWLKRRPDIRAAERELALATASIGVEAAELYPKLSLLGGFGYSGRSIGDIGDSGARKWSFGPSLQWRFLDVGRVRQYVKAAEANQRLAIANFQGTVLRALEDMENALSTYRATTEAERALGDALSESVKATRLARLRFDNGASNYLDVLDAQRTQYDSASQFARATTARSTALVAVYKALAAD
jgi:multidrug efflux system outer membrane protein